MGQAKRRGTYEERKQQATVPGHQVDLTRAKIEMPEYGLVLELITLAAAATTQGGAPMEESLKGYSLEDGTLLVRLGNGSFREARIPAERWRMLSEEEYQAQQAAFETADRSTLVADLADHLSVHEAALKAWREKQDAREGGATFRAMVIDRSPAGLAAADRFEDNFPIMRASIESWLGSGFEFLIFGTAVMNGESTMVWANDLEELLTKAIPALAISLAEKGLKPHFTLVVSEERFEPISTQLEALVPAPASLSN